MLDRMTYRLPQDCGLRGVRVLKAEFAASLLETQLLEIDCGDVERADLALLQLFVSADRTARRVGKVLHVTNASPAVRSAFARAGFPSSDTFPLTA